MNKKVMITGGAGFIGSHLIANLLNEGIEVHAMDVLPLEKCSRLSTFINKKNFYYTKSDLRDKYLLRDWYVKYAEHIYHLASVVGVPKYMDDPLSLIDIVIGGTRNILELACEFNTRVLFTSTSEIFGKNPKTLGKKMMIEF